MSVFRLFASLQLGILVVTAAAFLEHESPEHARSAVLAMITMTVLLLASLIPRPERRLGRARLALAVAIAVATPAVGQWLALLQGAQAYEKLSLELSLYQFVPVVVCAWSFGFRSVVVLAVASGALDLVLSAFAQVDAERAEVYRHVLVGRVAAYLAAGYIIARLVASLRAQRDHLREANAAITRSALSLEQLTVSRERNRMAGELHDTLAHTLSGLAVQLEAMRACWEASPTEARRTLDGALSSARAGLAETRRALHALRASPLDELGLVPALRHLAEDATGRAGVALELELPEASLQVSPALGQALYRITQEALENVARHAGARRVRVALSGEGRSLVLCVEDDGRGFDPGAVAEGHFGLRGIHERAEMLGGEAEVRSGEGAGARVRLVVDRDAGLEGAP